MNGEAIDPVPLEVSSVASTSATGLGPVLAASMDAYIISGRRLSAAGGWIDDHPLPNVIAAASNGIDFLVARYGSNGFGLVRVPSHGSAPSTTIALPSTASLPKLASNGSDYVVVWSTTYTCHIPECPSPPTTAYALRVRSDGSWIDAAPRQLSAAYTWSPSVAWTGRAYVAAWTESDGIHATRVAADGTVLDPAVLVETGAGNGAATVVPFNGDVIFFIHQVPVSGAVGQWTALRVRPDDLASSVAAERIVLPPTGGTTRCHFDQRPADHCVRHQHRPRYGPRSSGLRGAIRGSGTAAAKRFSMKKLVELVGYRTDDACSCLIPT